MSRPFVGRADQVAALASAVEVGAVRWVSGPAGIGKTTLIREALGNRPTLWLPGVWMQSRAEAIRCFREELGDVPAGYSDEQVSAWLATGLRRLGADYAAIVWEDFDRVHRGFANLMLDSLRRTGLCAIVIESRQQWEVPGLLGGRVLRLELGRLSPEASAELCRILGGSIGDMPERLRGHPCLTELFFETRARDLEEWLLSGMPAQAAELLKRLSLATTQLQGRWARRLDSTPDWGMKSLLGFEAVSAELQIFDPKFADRVRSAIEASGEKQELERSLVEFLASQPHLAAADLERALDLARGLGASELGCRILGEAADRDLEAEQLAVVGPHLDAHVLTGGLGAEAALRLYTWRSEAERVEALLDAHRQLDDTALTDLYLARAACASGLRELPGPARLAIARLDRRSSEIARLVTALGEPIEPDPLLAAALRDWQAGSHVALSRGCEAIHRAREFDRQPLSGRHFADYLPYCFAAIRDRDLDVWTADHADVLLEGLSRLKPSVDIELGAVALAQHALLHEAFDVCGLLAAALDRRHATALTALASADVAVDVVAALGPVVAPFAPVTSPHYVVLATRAVLISGAARSPLRELVGREILPLAMGKRPALILETCVEALDGDARVDTLLRRQLHRALGTVQPAEIDDPSVVALRAHIDELWFEPVDLAAFASTINVAASALARRFADLIGRTPAQYQRDRRVREATPILIETDRDLTSIAHECGYYDSAHFSRDFKNHTGSTPSEYRRDHRSTDSRKR